MGRRAISPLEALTRGFAWDASPAGMMQWTRIARTILRRWKLPSWVSEDDVLQDVMLAAWLHAPRFEQGRGVSPESYVKWNAFHFAKKKAHKARGSYRHRGEDSAPSRHDIPLSSFVSGDDMDEDGEYLLNRVATQPNQEHRLMHEDGAAHFAAQCAGRREPIVARAVRLSDGSVEDTARVLYEDAEMRCRLRLPCEAAAERFVKRVVRDVAARLGIAA